MPGGERDRIAPVTWLFGPADSAIENDVATPGPTPSAEASAYVDDMCGYEPISNKKKESLEREHRSSGSFHRISNVSMYALARRGMSSGEMRDYLNSREIDGGREFDSADVDDEIDRLEDVALLDDFALAETLVTTLRGRKSLGRSALSAELRRRRLDPDAIDQALGSLEDDELARAVAVAQKRAPQLRSLDSTTAKRRLSAFLMRKGYSGAIVSAAVQNALSSSGPTFR